jgi:hypothetical protein
MMMTVPNGRTAALWARSCVTDLHGVVALQREREFRFFSQDDIRKLELPGNLAVSRPSPYTHNIIAYLERRSCPWTTSRRAYTARTARSRSWSICPGPAIITGGPTTSRTGPRLHHIAVAVTDGERDGMENIDDVVNAIRSPGKEFLLDVIGSRDTGLKQVFSSASQHSSLIIEYVQRFGDLQGFFAKNNVALLTHAAGVEEELLELQAQARTQSLASPKPGAAGAETKRRRS